VISTIADRAAIQLSEILALSIHNTPAVPTLRVLVFHLEGSVSIRIPKKPQYMYPGKELWKGPQGFAPYRGKCRRIRWLISSHASQTCVHY
jgi:hypothetical protein